MTWTWIGEVNAESGTGFAGFSDWRIPNIKELQSIVDYRRQVPAIDPVFTPTAFSDVWSSTSHEGDAVNAWRVRFVDGNVLRTTKTVLLQVRAVRGGR